MNATLITDTIVKISDFSHIDKTDFLSLCGLKGVKNFAMLEGDLHIEFERSEDAFYVFMGFGSR